MGAPEAAAIQVSVPIVKSNMGVIYVYTTLPDNRIGVLKSQQEIVEENDKSEEIYEKVA